MDGFTCPWCGEDLLGLFDTLKPCPYDAVYEAHAEDCDVLQREIEGKTQPAPPCARDEE